MLYVLAAVLAVLLLLYMMPIKVSVAVDKNNTDDKITIGIRTMYGLLRFKSEIPFMMIKFEDGKPALKFKAEVANKKRSKIFARFTKLFTLREGEGLYELYKRNRKKIKPLLRYITRRTNIKGFNLKLSLGTGDAAETGMLYGAAWIIVGSVMAFTSNYVNVDNPKIVIVPIFAKAQLCVDFSCIICVKTGHIITAGIKTIGILLSDKQ